MSREILLTVYSPGGADPVFGCVWDFLLGTLEHTLKGEQTVKGGYSTHGGDIIVACHSTKSLINVWSLSKGQIVCRLSCPGRITALQCSRDGVYCIGAVSEKIYVWQLHSGKLLAVLLGHYQTVRALQFSDDGTMFLSGGDDNLVCVWQTASVLSSAALNETSPPAHVWSSHSLPVTCIHCGFGGVRSRVYSCSIDQTCKIWEMSSGQLLSSLTFETGVTTVTTDAAELRLFVGLITGDIHQVNLHKQFTLQLAKATSASSNSCRLQGHSQQVTSLAVSLDGCFLSSGSSDETVRVWHIGSQQCLKVLKQRGPVAGVSLLLRPRFLMNKLCFTSCIQPLQQNLHSLKEDFKALRNLDCDAHSVLPVFVPSSDDYENELRHTCYSREMPLSVFDVGDKQDDHNEQCHMKKLELTNEQLYQFGIQLLSHEMHIHKK